MDWKTTILTLLVLLAAESVCGHATLHFANLEPRENPQSTDKRQPNLVLQLGHVSGGITSVAYSPDGRLILTGSYDETACLWDAVDGRELRRFRGHEEAVNAVAFTRDGRFAVTGSGGVIESVDNTIRLWDIATGSEVRRFEGHAGGIIALAISADGRQILSGGYDKSARLWDISTGRQLKVFSYVDPATITVVKFVPRSTYIVIGGWYRPAQVLDISSGKEVRRFSSDSVLSNVTALAVSSNGSQLIGADGNILRMWELGTGREIRTFEGHTGNINSISFAPDEKTFCTGSGERGQAIDHSARLWDTTTGQELRRFDGHSADIASVTFSPDGRSLLTGSHDDTVRVWSVADGNEVRRLSGYSQSVHDVALSANGHYMVTASSGNRADLWDLTSGRVEQSFSSEKEGDYLSIRFAPDSQTLLAGSSDGSARLWEIESGKEQKRFTGEPVDKYQGRDFGAPLSVNAVAYSHDGRLVATGSGDETIRIWSVSTGKKLKQLGEIYKHSDEAIPPLSTPIQNLTFSPDGRRIMVTHAFSSYAILWDYLTGKQVRRFETPRPDDAFNAVGAIAFSPDGRYVLIGDEKTGASLCDTETGKIVKRFVLQGNGAMRATFSSDGRRILTAHLDGVARLWDIETGAEVRKFDAGGVLVSVEFTTNGSFVVTGSMNSTTRFWEVATGKEICRLVSLTDDTWVVVSPDGRFDTNNLEDIKGLHWVMPDDPFRALPLEIFMRQYYEPRLLPRLLAGEKLVDLPSLVSLNRSQPNVTIASIESDPNASGEVRVTVEVEKAEGTGVYDLRLFRDRQLVAFSPQPSELSDMDRERGDGHSAEQDLYSWRKENEIRLDPSGKATITFSHIKLPRNANIKELEFSAYAFNVDKVKSRTDKKKFEIPSNLTRKKGRAYIVAVGVNAYQNADFDLQFAADDARRFSQVVSKRLASSGQYEKVVTVLLLSDYQIDAGQRVLTRTDATKANFRAVLELLSGKRKEVDPALSVAVPAISDVTPVTPDDLVLIMYSSHGYRDNGTGNFYFIPYDTGVGTGKFFTKTVQRNSISSDELSLWLRDVDAGELVMIVDACHSTAAVAGRDFKPGPMGSRGLGQLSYDKGMRILTATQSDTVALENSLLRQGLLTYALLRDGLEGMQADYKPRNKSITLSEWLGYGVVRVPQLYEEIQLGKVQNFSALTGQTKVISTVASKDIVEVVTAAAAEARIQQPSLFDFGKRRADVILVNGQ